MWRRGVLENVSRLIGRGVEEDEVAPTWHDR